MSTVPSTSDVAPSGTHLCQPSPLVLALIGLGLTPADAIEIAKARKAETTRMSALEMYL